VVARTGAPEGLVRIAAPVGFGQSVLMPLVGSFLKLYPAVSLEMTFVDRHVDMVAEGFDLLVQYGAIADTSLVARHLMDYRRLLVASPGYLASRPTITRIEHVGQHDAIQLYAHTDHWTFVSQGDEVHVRVRSRLAVQNLFGIHRAALDGLGLALIPDYVVLDDVAAGRLTHVLPDVGTQTVRASLLYPSSRVQPIAVRKLVDFLVAELRGRRRQIR
jgi:DNA-binding transcriptional LysR family regulator